MSQVLDPAVQFREGGDGPIDAEIIDLVNALNRAGIVTTQSCCGHGESAAYISIDMASVEDVALREGGSRLVIWWQFGGARS